MSRPATKLLTDHEIVAVGKGGVISRDAFRRRVNMLIDAIVARRARRWALICDDSGWYAAGFVALTASKRTVVLPQAPQAGSLHASGANIDAILTDRPEEVANCETLAVAEPGESISAAPRAPDDAARIESWTSGSGGASKCVVKQFAQLRLEAAALEREWGERLGDALVVGTVPHHHPYGLMVRILWPLACGRTFVTDACTHAAALRAATAGRRCVIVSSPAFLSRIGNCSELPDAAQVAAVFSTGAPLADAIAEKLGRDWGRAVTEIYGSTETGGLAWRRWSETADRALWTPIQGVETGLRREAAGDRLWVRCSYAGAGHWAPTGDLVKCEPDGRFTLLGRADDVVKIGDKRVSLSEMRSRLVRHSWVSDASLLPVPGRRTVIGAAVILNNEGRRALHDSGKFAVCQTLRGLLREIYEPVLLPRKWRFPQQWPVNDMGKVSHAWLQDLFGCPAPEHQKPT